MRGVGARVDPEIFKAYDIRGLYGEQIDADLAELIGRCLRARARQAGRQGPPPSCGWGWATTCA